MQIKICGITNIEDAMLCSNLGGDALGFIFYEKSKRFISYDKAREIIQQLPPFILKIGVFVDEDFTKVNSAAAQIRLNAVQLHGNETPEYINNISLPVIKSFRVDGNFDWTRIDEFRNCRILLDAFSPNEMGGTGKKFNWDFIPQRIRNKIILSGGISIDNLETVFNEVNPAAIDISSSIESKPGKKDKQKVIDIFKEFKRLINNYNSKDH